MKCPKCNGTGTCCVWDKETFYCKLCHGTGEIEQANFNFMQSCTMEEMAELISSEVQEQISLYKYYKTPKRFSKISYIQWLKEKHT